MDGRRRGSRKTFCGKGTWRIPGTLQGFENPSGKVTGTSLTSPWQKIIDFWGIFQPCLMKPESRWSLTMIDPFLRGWTRIEADEMMKWTCSLLWDQFIILQKPSGFIKLGQLPVKMDDFPWFSQLYTSMFIADLPWISPSFPMDFPMDFPMRPESLGFVVHRRSGSDMDGESGGKVFWIL